MLGQLVGVDDEVVGLVLFIGLFGPIIVTLTGAAARGLIHVREGPVDAAHRLLLLVEAARQILHGF